MCRLIYTVLKLVAIVFSYITFIVPKKTKHLTPNLFRLIGCIWGLGEQVRFSFLHYSYCNYFLRIPTRQ